MEHDENVPNPDVVHLDRPWPEGKRTTSMRVAIVCDSTALAVAMAKDLRNAARGIDDHAIRSRDLDRAFIKDEAAYQERAKKSQNMDRLRDIAHGKRKHKNRAPGRRFD